MFVCFLYQSIYIKFCVWERERLCEWWTSCLNTLNFLFRVLYQLSPATDTIRKIAHFSYKRLTWYSKESLENDVVHKSILNGTFVWSPLCVYVASVQKELKYIRILHIHKIKTILHLFGMWVLPVVAHRMVVRVCVSDMCLSHGNENKKWQNHKRHLTKRNEK